MTRAVIASLCVLLSAPAVADTIFTDDFNRPIGDIVGNGWIETEVALSAAGIGDGFPDGGVLALKTLNGVNAPFVVRPLTNGESGLRLEFEYRGADVLQVITNVLGGIDVLATFEPSLSWAVASLVLPELSEFGFRFVPLSGNPLGWAEVDNVEVSSVPVPPAALLFESALAGLFLWRRRR